MKRIFVDMSFCIPHHGHLRLLQEAKALGGHVVVVLTSDEEVLQYKGFHPELNFEARKELLLGFSCVDEVVSGPWNVTDAFLKAHRADCLVHSGPNFNDVKEIEIVTFDRTEGVSSEDLRARGLYSKIETANSRKILLTPGPTNLHPECLLDIQPVFSRGDELYERVTTEVLERIRKLAGQEKIVAMQGSATTAIEVATSNFLSGTVVVLVSGYYSQRMYEMLERKKGSGPVEKVIRLEHGDFLKSGLPEADFVLLAYTETADAFLLDLKEVRRKCDERGAKLLVDATGSINLEDHHELADACMFSSCKGIGGLTGASFITFNRALYEGIKARAPEFVLDIDTFIEKKTTSPAHTLLGLEQISKSFATQRARVEEGKKAFLELYGKYLFRPGNQPNLCTKVVGAQLVYPQWTVPYCPRTAEGGTQVVCHLFEQFPSKWQTGSVYKYLKPQT
jgi:2-aminoethylphosphonate-pyruvate transaminase